MVKLTEKITLGIVLFWLVAHAHLHLPLGKDEGKPLIPAPVPLRVMHVRSDWLFRTALRAQQ